MSYGHFRTRCGRTPHVTTDWARKHAASATTERNLEIAATIGLAFCGPLGWSAAAITAVLAAGSEAQRRDAISKI